MMKQFIHMAMLAVLLFLSANASANDHTPEVNKLAEDKAAQIKAGQSKAAICAGCHNIAGYRTAFPEVYHVPKLGGQRAKYIETALQGYKKGQRKFATMHAMAASLSEQDIADIAAYYAAQTPISQDKPKR